MMNVTYGMTEERYFLGTDSRISYGIVAYADADEDGTATIVASVHDVTADKEALTKLASLCNRLGLSLIHLNDVLEDFLVGLPRTKKQAKENSYNQTNERKFQHRPLAFLRDRNASEFFLGHKKVPASKIDAGLKCSEMNF